MKEVEETIKSLEEEEKNEGSVDRLFQDIYSKSSDEVRRAMNKSFQESNGTVLNTNWAEVKSKKVEMKAPESSEFKKW